MDIKFNTFTRVLLWFVALIGLFGINTMFGISFFLYPEQMEAANQNLYAMAFVVEAFTLLPLFCYLIFYFKLKGPNWFWFFVLSIIGSLAFSIPLSLLLWERKKRTKN